LKILCRPARLDYVMLPTALLLTVAVQGVATSKARFYADDFMVVFAALNDGLSSLLQPHAGHVLFSFRLFVLGTLSIFGPNPTAFLVAGLVLHVMNVGLLYRIVRHLGVDPFLAGFVSTLWGIAPLNQGPLSWMAAQGPVVMTAATLWVLFCLRFTLRWPV
jgi:hypothetical protein